MLGAFREGVLWRRRRVFRGPTGESVSDLAPCWRAIRQQPAGNVCALCGMHGPLVATFLLPDGGGAGRGAEAAAVLRARLSEAEKVGWEERKAAIAAEPDDY